MVTMHVATQAWYRTPSGYRTRYYPYTSTTSNDDDSTTSTLDGNTVYSVADYTARSNAESSFQSSLRGRSFPLWVEMLLDLQKNHIKTCRINTAAFLQKKHSTTWIPSKIKQSWSKAYSMRGESVTVPWRPSVLRSRRNKSVYSPASKKFMSFLTQRKKT